MDANEAKKYIPMLLEEFYDFYPQYKLRQKKLSVEVTNTEEFYPNIIELDSMNCLKKASETLIDNFRKNNTDGMMLLGDNKKAHIVIDAESVRDFSHLSQIFFHELAHFYFMANDSIDKNQKYDTQQLRGYYFWHEFIAEYSSLTLIFRKNKKMTFSDIKYVADESFKYFIENCDAQADNLPSYLVSYYVALFHMDELNRKYKNPIDRRKFAGKDLDEYLEGLFIALIDQIHFRENMEKINKSFINTIGEYIIQILLYGEDYRYGSGF